jgi:glycosyltransferase involved in cell wall biosynthesis
MDTFPLGGISKSLLALFNELGDEFEIDFLLMKQEGIFIPLIPKNVNLLPEPIEHDFRNPSPVHVIAAFRNMPICRFVKWIEYSITCAFARIFGGLHKQVQQMDKWLGKNIAPKPKHYDAAIAYQGGRCIYYLVEGVSADIKIGYVHSDYSSNETDYMLYPTDKDYFRKLNHIVTISPKCANSLAQVFSDIKEKISVVENICSPKLINSMAAESCELDSCSSLKIVMMGRLDIEIKGIDLAIAAASILKGRGIDFKWFIIGDGKARSKVEQMIKDANIEDHFTILGAKTNPYPYLRSADIYVHPSRIEGKSVALDEVKALAKPVVVTNFSTVYDQFTDGVTALICEMNANDIADKILTMINNPELRAQLVDNLRYEKVGNEEQIEVFKSLLK